MPKAVAKWPGDADLDEMLRRAFAFAPHLQDGMRMYRSLLSR